MERKKITLEEAVQILKEYSDPEDYNCETWDEVVEAGLAHVDGFAACFDLDEEYIIDYN